jgi:hypothetical protein
MSDAVQSQGPGWWQASDGHWYPPSTQPGTLPPPPDSARQTATGAAADTTPASAWLVIAGGVLMAGGTFLPWITATSAFGSISRNGFQLGTSNGLTFDGPVTVLIAILTVVIGMTRLTQSSMPRGMQRSSIVTGIAVGLILVNRWSGIHDLVNQVNGSGVAASVGYGYWMCAVGAFIALCGGLALRQAKVDGT